MAMTQMIEEGGNTLLAVSKVPPRDSATLPQFGQTFLMILMMMVMMMFLVLVVVVVVLMVTLQPNYRHSVTHLLKLVKGDKMRNRRNALILHQMRVDSATMRMMAMTLTPQVVCLTGREAPPVDCAS